MTIATPVVTNVGRPALEPKRPVVRTATPNIAPRVSIPNASSELQPHPLDSRGPACVGQLSPMHVPMVRDELKTKPIGAKDSVETCGNLSALLVQIRFGKRLQERDRRLTDFAAFREHFIERRELADVPTRVRTVENLLPQSQWIDFTQHERADDETLDVGQMPERPQRVTPSVRRREHDTMFTHLFDAKENPVPAPLEIVAYEIDGLHIRFSEDGGSRWGPGLPA